MGRKLGENFRKNKIIFRNEVKKIRKKESMKQESKASGMLFTEKNKCAIE